MMRRYTAYRDSGVDWLGEVPEGWVLQRLRFAATLNPSKSELVGLDTRQEVSFIPMEAVGEYGELDVSRTQPIAEVKTGYTYLRNGDMTFAKITPCFENGKRAMMRDLIGGIGFGTTELTVVRPRVGRTTTEFLFWLLSSSSFRKTGEAFMYGAGGQKRVPDDFVRDFVVALPPLPEQTAIAAFLDRETAKIDALVAEQRHLIELLREKRQAVVSHAVTKGLNPAAPMKPSGVDWLGDVPEGWEVVPTGYRYEVQLGRMLNEDRASGENLRPYLRVADVQWGAINVDDLPLMDFPPSAQGRYRLRQGDLMVNEGGSYVGRSAIWKGELEECYYQKALHRLRPRSAERDTAEFFLFVMEVATTRNVFAAFGNQTTIDHLTADQLRAHRFAFPPLHEQIHIADYLRAAVAKFADLTTNAESAITLLQERRSALISAAVTGKVDVRDVFGEETEAA